MAAGTIVPYTTTAASGARYEPGAAGGATTPAPELAGEQDAAPEQPVSEPGEFGRGAVAQSRSAADVDTPNGSEVAEDSVSAGDGRRRSAWPAGMAENRSRLVRGFTAALVLTVGSVGVLQSKSFDAPTAATPGDGQVASRSTTAFGLRHSYRGAFCALWVGKEHPWPQDSREENRIGAAIVKATRYLNGVNQGLTHGLDQMQLPPFAAALATALEHTSIEQLPSEWRAAFRLFAANPVAFVSDDTRHWDVNLRDAVLVFLEGKDPQVIVREGRARFAGSTVENEEAVCPITRLRLTRGDQHE